MRCRARVKVDAYNQKVTLINWLYPSQNNKDDDEEVFLGMVAATLIEKERLIWGAIQFCYLWYIVDFSLSEDLDVRLERCKGVKNG